MIRNVLRAVCAEPRAPHLPRRVDRDWLLVGALVLSAVLEGIFRPDVVWRGLAIVLAVGLAFTLLWRRTHPLPVIATVAGVLIAVDVATSIAGLPQTFGLYTMIYIVLLPYSLYRWASGKEIVFGTLILLTMAGAGLAADWTTFGEAVAGLVFFSFPGMLGASVRVWTTSRLRELDRVRSHERAELARELHDTVAHHVSAMVVRAQAGRVVAETDPAHAVQALELIEAEGSKTLAEMRFMVGALREPGRAELAPQTGLADLPKLARAVDGEPSVSVSLSLEDGVDGVTPAVGAALYRIAQESVTNALRHARGARRVSVEVTASETCVRLRVEDDGDPVASAWGTGAGVGPGVVAGFGIAGMRERAALLGGRLTAGPGVDGGWVVDAELPRVGSAA